jgi:hypothetical protein
MLISLRFVPLRRLGYLVFQRQKSKVDSSSTGVVVLGHKSC